MLCRAKPKLRCKLLILYKMWRCVGVIRCARPSGSLLAGSSSVQLAAPLLSPSLGLAPSEPEQALFKNAPGVFVSNPGRWFSSPL
ncbi:hypothetical protein GPB19_000154 [Salmonella enterica]|nr:hypothetical protein [Salmonella enterica]